MSSAFFGFLQKNEKNEKTHHKRVCGYRIVRVIHRAKPVSGKYFLVIIP